MINLFLEVMSTDEIVSWQIGALIKRSLLNSLHVTSGPFGYSGFRVASAIEPFKPQR